MTNSHFESIGTLSDSVRDVETEDGAVLLDIRRGACLSLTPVGLQIWRLLKRERSFDEIVDCLADEFHDVDKPQIHDDAIEFISELRSKSLLFSRELRLSPSLIPKPLVLLQRLRECGRHHNGAQSPHALFWRALSWLVAFDLFRLGSNFAGIHALVRSWKTAPVSPAINQIGPVCQAVNYASMWYPKRVLCLQRSAVTTCLLRTCGIPAQMVIGAQKFPFKAHAWTEVDGRAINERRDVQKIYLVWERC
jgi:hypothetical protein